MPSMPLRVDVGGNQRATLEFEMTPTERGLKRFDFQSTPAALESGAVRLESAHRHQRVPAGISKLRASGGILRGSPGERRLSEMGIKAVRRRGTGTDFDQLVEYPPGRPDPPYRLESYTDTPSPDNAKISG